MLCSAMLVSAVSRDIAAGSGFSFTAMSDQRGTRQSAGRWPSASVRRPCTQKHSGRVRDKDFKAQRKPAQTHASCVMHCSSKHLPSQSTHLPATQVHCYVTALDPTSLTCLIPRCNITGTLSRKLYSLIPKRPRTEHDVATPSSSRIKSGAGTPTGSRPNVSATSDVINCCSSASANTIARSCSHDGPRQ